MQKQAPTLGRLATMVFFALSCFGLLMFLWLAFGGPTPLKPVGYQFKIAFPEASQIATQSDVRVAGVEIGKVVAVKRTPNGDATVATLEIDRKYAPLSADAKAQMRNKTILGQTYVELTLDRRRRTAGRRRLLDERTWAISSRSTRSSTRSTRIRARPTGPGNRASRRRSTAAATS
jgi:ABC-type transporter Mla subunit MlaD